MIDFELKIDESSTKIGSLDLSIKSNNMLP
jgi:hypothetical protein